MAEMRAVSWSLPVHCWYWLVEKVKRFLALAVALLTWVIQPVVLCTLQYVVMSPHIMQLSSVQWQR